MRAFTALCLALLFITSMGMADPLYKWVDDKGNVHYSDKPQPGAKQVKLPPATTFTAPTPAVPAPNETQTTSERAARVPYTEFEISSPEPNATLWNVTTVTVMLDIKPGLQAGDRVNVTLDGKMQSSDKTAQLSFDDLDRGEHTVSANLQAADGSVMIAKPVTFFIQRTTIKHPP